MTAVRWFLTYLFPMLIILTISASYLNRDQLFSDWFTTLTWPITQINSVLQQHKLLKNNVDLITQSPEETNNLSEVISNTDLSKSDSDSDLKSNTTISVEQVISKIKTKKPLLEKEKKQKSIITEDLTFTEQTQPVTSTTDDDTPAEHTTFQARLNSKQRVLLNQARKAYWTSDVFNSKKYYLALLAQLPNNADIHGELGNLFYLEHNLKLANEQYYIAARLLVNQQLYWKLGNIMPFLFRFDPTNATDIMRYLYQQKSRNFNSRH